MREILFRGKRVDNGEWVYGLLMRHESYSYILPENPVTSVGVTRRYRVHPKTVGQFTGLPDKNGDRIFEDDILKTHPILAIDENGDDELHVTVYWQDGSWISNGILGSFQAANSEILGNIHDK